MYFPGGVRTAPELHPSCITQLGCFGLFSDTPKGAESSAIVYSLVETAKANGIDPYTYLLRVLSLLPYLGKNPSNAELDELLPWHPRMQASLRRDDNLI